MIEEEASKAPEKEESMATYESEPVEKEESIDNYESD